MSEADVTNLLTNFIEPKTDASNTIQKEIVNYEKKGKRTFFTGIITGTIITIIASLTYKNIDKIISTIHKIKTGKTIC